MSSSQRAAIACPNGQRGGGSGSVASRVSHRERECRTGVEVVECRTKLSPLSCETVKLSPMTTGVMPSERSTVPSDGSEFTVTVKAEAANPTSVGEGMAIGVARLFSATVSDAELAIRLVGGIFMFYPNVRSKLPNAVRCARYVASLPTQNSPGGLPPVRNEISQA